MTLEAVIFDWGGTLTPWHNIDLVAQWYPYAQVYDPVNAAALAQRLFDAEESLWRRQRETGGAAGTVPAVEALEGAAPGSAWAQPSQPVSSSRAGFWLLSWACSGPPPLLCCAAQNSGKPGRRCWCAERGQVQRQGRAACC